MHRSRDRALSDDFILASPRLISCTELEASGKKHRHYFENLKFRGTFQNLQTSWEACKMSAMFVTIRKRPVFELLCLNAIFEGVMRRECIDKLFSFCLCTVVGRICTAIEKKRCCCGLAIGRTFKIKGELRWCNSICSNIEN